MTEDDWKYAASQLLRVEMQRKGVTFRALSRRLVVLGVNLEGAQLSNKVNRGTFSMVFFLQCMRALDVEAVRLFDVELEKLKARESA